MIILWTADPFKKIQQVLGTQLGKSGVPYKIVGLEHGLPNTKVGDIVLAMGLKTVEQLQAKGLIPKNKKSVVSVRYPFLYRWGPLQTPFLFTYQAVMVDREYDKSITCQTDLALAIRWHKTGSFEPIIGDYKYVADFNPTIQAIKDKFNWNTQTPVEVALDLETLGLNPWDPKAYIVSIQVTYQAGQADVIRFDNKSIEEGYFASWKSHMLWLLNTPWVSLRGANLKYDLVWLWVRAGVTCSNFKFDTLLVGSLLDENRGNSLSLHTKIYVPLLAGYDAHLEATYDKSRMDLVPPADLLTYGGGDTDSCLQVAAIQKTELLKDKKLTAFYVNVLHPASRAFEKVERTGLLVNVPYYLELENEIKTEIKRLEKKAFAVLGGRLIVKHRKKDGTINLTKAALLKDFMFSPGGLNLKPLMFTEVDKLPSTSLDHLMMFRDNKKAAPFLDVLKEYGSAVKTLNTYVVKRDEDGNITGGFLSHLRPDSRFHPTYFLWKGDDEDDESGGAVTGRLSAKDPAVQTIPKHTIWAMRLRHAFIAPPGMVIVSKDYQQGELKIAACLANEERMIEAYRSGIDLHAVTASSIAGWEWEDFMNLKITDPEKFEFIRFLGKASNFGLIYGQMPPGYQAYAEINYGVKMTLREATTNRDIFFATYPGLIPWHNRYKLMAEQQTLIRSPLGRIRHLPLIHSPDKQASSKAGRQAVNSPVQATLSDMILWSIALFDKEHWLEKHPVIGMIHDQLLNYAPEDKWEEQTAEEKYVMENLPFKTLGWSPQLKFTVDVEVGKDYGNMKKQKIEAQEPLPF